MIITITISKEEIELLESGDFEATSAASELYRYTLLQASMTSKGLSEDGPTNYFVISPPYDIKGNAKTALCVPHPKDYPNAGLIDMDKAWKEKEGQQQQEIDRPEVRTDIPNAFKNIRWNDEEEKNEN